MIEGSEVDFILAVVIALLGGVLVGLERERAQYSRGGAESKPGSIPGMRSFGLLSIYGAVTAYASRVLAPGSPGGSAVLPVSIAAFTVIVAIHSYTRMVKQRVLGVTTYIVMLVTFFIGFLAGYGKLIESASLSVLVTLVLALKYPAERLAQALNYKELLAMLEVAALALVAGPIVRTYSVEAGADIIFKVYAFFTIVLLISFTSYAAARVWGAKGIVYAAALGSLVNSEATISSITGLVGEIGDSRLRRTLLSTLTPIVIAVLQARAALLMALAVYIFEGSLPRLVVLASAALASTSLLIASIATRAGTPSAASLRIESPLSWKAAAKSALAYLILTVAFTSLPEGTGQSVTLLLAVLGGLVNATATILSLATTLSTIGICTATTAMLLSIASATANKILYAETGRLQAGEARLILYWSLGASLLPAALAGLVTALC